MESKGSDQPKTGRGHSRQRKNQEAQMTSKNKDILRNARIDICLELSRAGFSSLYTKSSPPPIFVNKLYWNTDLYIVYGYFHTTEGLNSYNIDHWSLIRKV